MEIWGGIESTVNRVGNRYFTQLDRSGHESREGDLDQCAALGIRTLRYPLLWERVAPASSTQMDWEWTDKRLHKLNGLGVGVIAGLLHHGSGPSYTSLVEPDFAELFARYAAGVAQRYPWIESYTPVNEPLTTARFSGLYGVWYPHGRDERIFKKALLNQCRAVVLGMREIRRVNPRARLVQTEDLGKTYSTAPMAYQAQFNNELRWLTWDLLSGRVDSSHPLWHWLTSCCQASVSELMWFADNPCPPDLIGVNHYITSERFLDERTERYPTRYHGGNGKQAYADIEAARCLARPTPGLPLLLDEVWERYGTPLAITEVHMDASREDQLRWFHGVWKACQAAKQRGVAMEAVTAWSLFGSFDWNCLLTEENGYYETGVFDVRAPQPQPTAIASLITQLASTQAANHPVLNQPGWWQRNDRFLCTPAHAVQLAGIRLETLPSAPAKPILICGASGTLGQAFGRICKRRGLAHVLLTRQAVDIADRKSVEAALEHFRPWAVVNAAGYVRVDAAETDVEGCFRENTFGPEVLATACARLNIPLATFSSDLVFGGDSLRPYMEADMRAPLNIYGHSKAEAETKVLAAHPQAIVIRTSAFFGPWDRYNFVAATLETLKRGESARAADDIIMSPTYVPDLVNATLDLIIDGASGTWHLTNGCALTWSELAIKAADMAGGDASLVVQCSNASFQHAAVRPAYSALASSRNSAMPSLDNALDRFLVERDTA